MKTTFKKKIVIITGYPGSGKTSLMERLAKSLTQEKLQISGFLLKASGERAQFQNTRAKEYHFEILGSLNCTPIEWLNKDGIFRFDNFQKVKEIISSELQSNIEFFFLDNVGSLELKGEGFSELLKNVLVNEKIKNVIISVQTKSFNEIVDSFLIDNFLKVDLNIDTNADKKVEEYLSDYRGEKIGLYSTINGLVEATVGSALHSLHIPLRGTFLSFAQGFMMTLFGKELKGKGLIWIPVITSGLKSFSPAGAKLKPMLFIFLQGFFYVLPSWFIGFNYISIMIGYSLLVLINLFLPLFFDYLIFGSSVIEAYIEGAKKVFEFVGFSNFTLVKFFILLSVIRIILAIIISTISYFFNFSHFLESMRTKVSAINVGILEDLKVQSWKESLKGSFFDLLSKRFYLPFIFIIILIYFLTHLRGMAFATVLIRGIILSWFGFLLSRRINFEKIIGFLEDRNLPHVAHALTKSAGILNSYIRKR